MGLKLSSTFGQPAHKFIASKGVFTAVLSLKPPLQTLQSHRVVRPLKQSRRSVGVLISMTGLLQVCGEISGGRLVLGCSHLPAEMG